MSKKQYFIGYTTDDSQRLFENGRIPPQLRKQRRRIQLDQER